uniref:Uncharacterized protein n=1 Tax=Cacopsylla melanoneura TaxID=428564 RepID=A0A8D8TIP8_9HEMI
MFLCCFYKLISIYFYFSFLSFPRKTFLTFFPVPPTTLLVHSYFPAYSSLLPCLFLPTSLLSSLFLPTSLMLVPPYVPAFFLIPSYFPNACSSLRPCFLPYSFLLP